MVQPKPDTETVKDEDKTGDEGQEAIFLSIRRTEALRELSGDIEPLLADGRNLHAWVEEVDEVLADLIERDKYLQSAPPEPLNKAQDKVARSLIYRTIPRELRYCLRDAASAHTAYRTLAAQFLRNTRTAHMAGLVDLFNFRMAVRQPGQISVLYDEMYKSLQELVANGFVISEDSLLGALFQIALGRSNLELYSSVSQHLDAKMGPDSAPVTAQEVAAVARMLLEHDASAAPDEPVPLDPPSQAPPADPSLAPTFVHGTTAPPHHPPYQPNHPLQATAEPHGNMANPHPNAQHAQQQQQQQQQQHVVQEHYPQPPPMQPPYNMSAGQQQPQQGPLAQESLRPHVPPPVGVSPGLPNPDTLGSDPGGVPHGHGHSEWLSQFESLSSAHPQQAAHPSASQPGHPASTASTASPAPPPAASPAIVPLDQLYKETRLIAEEVRRLAQGSLSLNAPQPSTSAANDSSRKDNPKSSSLDPKKSPPSKVKHAAS